MYRTILFWSTYFLWILAVFIFRPEYSIADDTIHDKTIHEIMTIIGIISHGDSKCHYFPINAREEFYRGKYDHLYHDSKTIGYMKYRQPIYSYSPCITKYNLGNSLGNYFHEISCAMEASTNLVISHLVADNPHTPIEFQTKNKHRYRNREGYHDESDHYIAFFDALPIDIDADYSEYHRLTSTSYHGSNFTMEYLVPKYPNSSSLLVLKNKLPLSSSLSSLSSLPCIKQTSSPEKRLIASKSNLKSKCKCEKYCWSDPSSPWLKYHEIIQVIMRSALEYNMEKSVNISRGTILRNDLDSITSYNAANYSKSSDSQSHRNTNHNYHHNNNNNNNNNNSNSNNNNNNNHHHQSIPFLPLIPEVALHYRCGDQVPSDIYGFLTLTTIISIIQSRNSSPKTIYILSDHPKRAGLMSIEPPFTANCRPILEALSKKLRSYYPNTIILILRGADPILDQMRLAFASISICSISTFCLWPAMANVNHVYFPATTLVSGVSTKDTIHHQDDIKIPSIIGAKEKDVIVTNSQKDSQLPYFGDHFYWIKKPVVIMHFQSHSKLVDILHDLEL